MAESADYATTLVAYRDSLRDAQSTGAGRDYLGFCPTQAHWNELTSSSCRKPHHGEIFGVGGDLSHEVARTTLTSSCEKLVSQVTKNDHFADADHLMVDVQVIDMNGTTVTGPMIPMNSNLQCGVVAAGRRMLQGSLIAIGDEPLPWA